MTIRLGGLQSGMDTESIISTLLEVERIPQLRAQNTIYELEDKLVAWNAIDSSATSLSSASGKLIAYSTWQQMKAEPANSSMMTATADTTAGTAKYDVFVDYRHRQLCDI